MSTTDCDSDTNPLPSKSSSSGYVITDALKAPRATTYTAQALFDQIMNGDIDLDPEYQRGPLFLLFCSSSCSFGCHRHRLARGEAGRPHRLHFPQLLHPSCHLLYAHPSHSAFQVSHVLSLFLSRQRPRRWLRAESMYRRKAASHFHIPLHAGLGMYLPLPISLAPPTNLPVDIP